MLTQTNAVTINPVASSPNMIRIAEKGHKASKLEAIGEYFDSQGMIEGLIELAGEQCPFKLKLQSQKH